MKRKSPLALSFAILASTLLLFAGCRPAEPDYPTTDTNVPAMQPAPTNTIEAPANDPVDRTPTPPPAP